MKARVTAFLNVRTGVPEILPNNNPLNTYYRPGDVIDVVETVLGERHQGNNVWLKLVDGTYVSAVGVDPAAYAKPALPPLAKENDLLKRLQLRQPLTARGNGIAVAVLDSGIALQHPALAQNIEQHDFLTLQQQEITNDHGLKVASVIAGNAKDITGIAMGCSLKSFRVIKNNQYLDERALMNALLHLVNNNVHVDVVNCSFDLSEDAVPFIQPLVDQLQQRGVLIVVAGGSASAANNTCKLKGVIKVGVFEPNEFELMKQQTFPYDVIFVNEPVNAASVTGGNTGYSPFKDDSLYTAVTVGLLAAYLSAAYIPYTRRVVKVRDFLKSASFPIKQENSPTIFKPYHL